MKKLILTQKLMNLTSKWHAEHLFAGQNTQQLFSMLWRIVLKSQLIREQIM